MNIRGRIHTIATVTRALKHGGQTVGNVQEFARHSVTDPDGERVDVPHISANSIKHLVREAGADFALEAMGLLEPDSLTRAEQYLMFAGGALDSGGQSIRLDKARRVEKALPILGLCGYAAGNSMSESQLIVEGWELVCWENSQRLRPVLEKYAPEHLPLLETYADEWIEVAQRTGHDPTRTAKGRRMLPVDERLELEAQLSGAKGSGAKDAFRPMPFEYETLIPGAVLVGGFAFKHGVRDLELQAFRSAITWASEGRGPDGGVLLPVGGGGSTAQGLASTHLHGELAVGIEPMRYRPTDELAPAREVGDGFDEALTAYVDHLSGHAEEAKLAMQELL